MNAIDTFNRLRPTDDELDDMTSARIFDSILHDTAVADDATVGVDDEIAWPEPLIAVDRRFRRLTGVAAAAALVVSLGGLVAVRSTRTHRPVAVGSAEPAATSSSLSAASAPSGAPSSLPERSPAGGLHLGGQVPSCTQVAPDAYRCTLAQPYDASMPDARNEVGMTTWYLDDASVVAGGCRTTTADAHEWLCFVGQRAVEERTIGQALLGTRQQGGFVAG